jgi:hypothetical protein
MSVVGYIHEQFFFVAKEEIFTIWSVVKYLWSIATTALNEKIAMLIIGLIPKLLPYAPIILMFL